MGTAHLSRPSHFHCLTARTPHTFTPPPCSLPSPELTANRRTRGRRKAMANPTRPTCSSPHLLSPPQPSASHAPHPPLSHGVPELHMNEVRHQPRSRVPEVRHKPRRAVDDAPAPTPRPQPRYGPHSTRSHFRWSRRCESATFTCLSSNVVGRTPSIQYRPERALLLAPQRDDLEVSGPFSFNLVPFRPGISGKNGTILNAPSTITTARWWWGSCDGGSGPHTAPVPRRSPTSAPGRGTGSQLHLGGFLPGTGSW